MRKELAGALRRDSLRRSRRRRSARTRINAPPAGPWPLRCGEGIDARVDRVDGHIPAGVLGRWETFQGELRGLERALVRHHLARCTDCPRGSRAARAGSRARGDSRARARVRSGSRHGCTETSPSTAGPRALPSSSRKRKTAARRVGSGSRVWTLSSRLPCNFTSRAAKQWRTRSKSTMRREPWPCAYRSRPMPSPTRRSASKWSHLPEKSSFAKAAP